MGAVIKGAGAIAGAKPAKTGACNAGPGMPAMKCGTGAPIIA